MTFAWVIERDESEHGRPEYFTGRSHPALRWSNPGDHEAAIRFARRVDAERMALAVDGARKHRIAEHGWEDEMPHGCPNCGCTEFAPPLPGTQGKRCAQCCGLKNG